MVRENCFAGIRADAIKKIGIFVDDEMVGQGRAEYPSGSIVEGSYLRGNKNGP